MDTQIPVSGLQTVWATLRSLGAAQLGALCYSRSRPSPAWKGYSQKLGVLTPPLLSPGQRTGPRAQLVYKVL